MADCRATRGQSARPPSGSHHLHDQITEEDRLRIRGPRNQFPLEPAPRASVRGRWGGYHPDPAMVAETHAAGRPWRLVYGARSVSEMAFTDELGAYGDRVVLVPQDTDGLIDMAGLVASAAPGTTVHCCGPAPPFFKPPRTQRRRIMRSRYAQSASEQTFPIRPPTTPPSTLCWPDQARRYECRSVRAFCTPSKPPDDVFFRPARPECAGPVRPQYSRAYRIIATRYSPPRNRTPAR